MAVLDNMLHVEPLRTVTSIKGSGSEGRMDVSVNENSSFRPDTSIPKFKRQKVSAVRHFPPGCGRSATRVTAEPATAVASKDCHVDSSAGNVCQSFQQPALPSSNAILKSKEDGVKLDKSGVSSAGFDDPNSMPEDQVPLVIQRVLDSIRLDERPKDIKSESSAFCLNSPFLEHAASSSKGIEESKPKDHESCSNVTSPPAHLDFPKCSKYPPPRRVSAVRDFPPLCGRNARNAPICNVEANSDVKTDSFNMGKCLNDGRVLQAPVLEKGIEEESRRSLDYPLNRKLEEKVLTAEEQHGRDAAFKGDKNSEPETSHILTQGAPESDLSLNLSCEKVVVLALSVGLPSSSLQNDKAPTNRPANCLTAKKGKKQGSSGLVRQKAALKKRLPVDITSESQVPEKNTTSLEESDHEASWKIIVWDNDEDDESDEQINDFRVSYRSREFSVNPPPFGHPNVRTEHDDNHSVTRSKVRETLRLFQAVCRKLLQEEESKSKEENKHKRVDLQAGKILKEKKKFVNTGKQIIGHVPGVEVGDEFQYRVELNVIGLHRQLQAGIDYINHGGKVLATSIVSSGAYDDAVDSSEFLIYTGQGGNVVSKVKVPEDQKLERGNLALKNSIAARNPVRVIRGLKETKASDSVDVRSRVVVTYIYDGLYTVEKCWQERGQHGKLVFKFHLNRIPGQPELAWKVVKKAKKFGVREGLCVHDISQGKEAMPIPAVNTIDNEKPPPFTYITGVIYPDFCRSIPPRGCCDCIRECSDSEKCACAVKNGGEIPFNYNGAIVEAKPLVYECGPYCKCPPSCHNRVSQRGIKFPLEIFKTESRGWGVRSLASIPSGSFICEYIGELLEDKEAEKRMGNDEYLFDIGNNYNDSSLWGELSTIIPDAHASSSEVVEDVGFTIDAAKYGNVGRFINHSCSPNLYAQNVLYDHYDKRIPHIMFFAAENIPPLQELTYHYNYMIDEVHDSNGNIKMKSCYCGSSDCTGRMY